jgi:hypothetical protein
VSPNGNPPVIDPFSTRRTYSGRQNITGSCRPQAGVVDTRSKCFLHCADDRRRCPSGGGHVVDSRRRGFRRAERGEGRVLRATAAFVLGLTLLCPSILPPSAAAAERETRLLSITKTTIYGALLGGILGLASALVVRDGYEDDAVRWGIVLGAFGGFAYGVATPEEDEWDDLSLQTRNRHTGPVGGHWLLEEDSVRSAPRFYFGHRLSLPRVCLTGKPEVCDGHLEEEETKGQEDS